VNCIKRFDLARLNVTQLFFGPPHNASTLEKVSRRELRE